MEIFEKPFGFVGERKACVLLCLAFYMGFFALLSLLLRNAPPDQPEIRAWWACFAALGACYGVSFFALGAGWFWARWVAIGLGYSGLTLAGWSIITQRSIEPVMAFYGLTHGVIALFLQGQRLVEEYDAKPAWRKALGLDDKAVVQVRQSVTRAAASLPTLIMIALSPREGQEGLWVAALAIVGLCGLLQMRTVGVLALFTAGLLLPWTLLSHSHVQMQGLNPSSVAPFLSYDTIHLMGLSAAALLLAASAPYMRPVLRFLRSRPAVS